MTAKKPTKKSSGKKLNYIYLSSCKKNTIMKRFNYRLKNYPEQQRKWFFMMIDEISDELQRKKGRSKKDD